MNLKSIWQEQVEYNSEIRTDTNNFDEEYWTQIYLLGLVSEIDEILRDINWKKHRKEQNRTIDLENLAYELADLTKYVISLWELWGFTSEDMLSYVDLKSKILQDRKEQEFTEIPEDHLVLITDIDGTLGNWRSSFINWASSQGYHPIIDDPATSLALDTDLSLRYAEYSVLKEKFESEGGYRHIIPYQDAVDVIKQLGRQDDIYIIAYTARPQEHYHRIWMDTWQWLGENCPVHELRIGAEARILLADSMKNNYVLMLEDDPGLMLRAAMNGINVIARRQPYNEHIQHKNITMVSKFTEIPDLRQYFAKKKEK